MSVTPSSSTPAVRSDSVEGLEDFDSSDAVMPTLRIEHQDGVFKDGQSGQEFDELNVILLGMVKQRVLWEPEIEEDKNGLLCRSYNFSIGHPNEERFPYEEAGFADGDNVLPCESCKLKDWGTHPKRNAPWCSMQYTFPLLRITDDGGMVPCLFTVQRSALQDARAYCSSFAGEGRPLYTAVTNLTLDNRKRGSVKFAVPKFKRTTKTEEEFWGEYANRYRFIREFIQRPRNDSQAEAEGHEDEAPPMPSTKAEPAPAKAAPAKKAEPAKAAEPAPAPKAEAKPAPAPAAAPDDDDEIPF